MVDEFEKLCDHQEEPFPSSSIYAQYKVYELATAHQVKVVLDGQGADEVLAGYHKYAHWYLQEMISRYRFKAASHEKSMLLENNVQFKWGIKNLVAAFLPFPRIHCIGEENITGSSIMPISAGKCWATFGAGNGKGSISLL